MLNVTCLSCFICCPTMVINSETRGRVVNSSTQSDSDPVATASLVYAKNQVNQMQTVGSQYNQGLSNQGSRETEVSKFVNKVELNRSNSPMTPDNINKENGSEYSGSESPPPPPPPRKQDSENPSPVAGSLQLNISQGNPEGYRSDSPPPPPPPREQRQSSPLPEINPKILSPGFMGIGPFDPQTGDRLNTIEVPKHPLTSVEAAGKNPGKASQHVGVNQNALWV